MTEIMPTWSDLITFVTQQMGTNEFFQTAGFFGALAFLGNYLGKGAKYLWERARRKLLYKVTVYQPDMLYYYIEDWMGKHHSSSYRNVQAMQGGGKDIEKHHLEDSFLIFRGLVPILVKKSRDKLENASTSDHVYIGRFEFRALLGKRALTGLLDQVMKYQVEIRMANPVKVYANTNNYWERIRDIEPKPIDSIFLSNKDELLEDMNRFLGSEALYEKRSLPYKRGYLFHGPPGNGKTSFCLSLAKHVNRDIYFFVLGREMNDSRFLFLYQVLPKDIILVIEDVDACFALRETESKLSFSTILNCMDGAFSKKGIITILTTNHKEKLDPALIRQGRIDVDVPIMNPDTATIEAFMSKFYERPVSIGNRVREMSMAEVQEHCSSNELEDCIRVLSYGNLGTA